MMSLPSLKVTVFFVCVLKWSLLGVKKRLGHAQIGLLRGLIIPGLCHGVFTDRYYVCSIIKLLIFTSIGSFTYALYMLYFFSCIHSGPEEVSVRDGTRRHINEKAYNFKKSSFVQLTSLR